MTTKFFSEDDIRDISDFKTHSDAVESKQLQHGREVIDAMAYAVECFADGSREISILAAQIDCPENELSGHFTKEYLVREKNTRYSTLFKPVFCDYTYRISYRLKTTGIVIRSDEREKKLRQSAINEFRKEMLDYIRSLDPKRMKGNFSADDPHYEWLCFSNKGAWRSGDLTDYKIVGDPCSHEEIEARIKDYFLNNLKNSVR